MFDTLLKYMGEFDFTCLSNIFYLLHTLHLPQQFLCYPKPLYKINMICGWSAHPSDKELGDIDSEEVSSLAILNIYLLSRWVIYLLNSLKVF